MERTSEGRSIQMDPRRRSRATTALLVVRFLPGADTRMEIPVRNAGPIVRHLEGRRHRDECNLFRSHARSRRATRHLASALGLPAWTDLGSARDGATRRTIGHVQAVQHRGGDLSGRFDAALAREQRAVTARCVAKGSPRHEGSRRRQLGLCRRLSANRPVPWAECTPSSVGLPRSVSSSCPHSETLGRGVADSEWLIGLNPSEHLQRPLCNRAVPVRRGAVNHDPKRQRVMAEIGSTAAF